MPLTEKGQKLVKWLVIGGGAFVVLFGVLLAAQAGYLGAFGIKSKESKSVSNIAFKETGFKKEAVTASNKLPLPSMNPTAAKGNTFVVGVIPWNANMGQMYANGGAFTTQSSLMEKYGVKMRLTRQDKPDIMRNEQLAFANALKNGEQFPREGMAFVELMGDGVPAYLMELTKMLAPLGPEYRPRIIGSGGRSYGEDALWGPESWLNDPSTMKGAVIAGVLGDGDWCIAMSFLSKNSSVIRNNPDPTTYDPDAVNWVNTDASSDAVRKCIEGYKEKRPVVRNGKRTGETQEITVQGFVGWTPDDVTYAKEKGGLTRILSTAPGENSEEMPMIIIGIDKFIKSNPQLVKNFLKATLEGGDQVRSFPEALQFASVVSDKVYQEKGTGPAYWAKYYQGTVENDATGAKVHLGGSAVHNLGDNLKLFGIEGDSVNPVSPYSAVYDGFGKIVLEQFLTKEKGFPKYSDVFEPRFLIELARENPNATQAALTPDYSGGDSGKRIGNRNWAIEFNSGSAQLTPQGQKVIKELATELLNNSATIELIGHTDNTGASDSALRQANNQQLSVARAQSVKNALQSLNKSAFPNDRFRKVEGHGESEPIADNNSLPGRARNRRVQVELFAGK